MLFIPMIMDAVGGSWGPQAHKVWAALAKSTAQSEGERPEAAADRIFQNLGLILHRENARAILRRATPASTADSSILAAAISAAAVEAPVSAYSPGDTS